MPVHPLAVEGGTSAVPPRADGLAAWDDHVAMPPRPEPARAEPRTEPARPDDPLSHWVAVARACIEACLVVDAGGNIAAVSPTAAEILGTPEESYVGRPLDEAISLVDFTDSAQEARGVNRRIPPLIAVTENALSRGMIRIRRADGHRLMLDAVAAPIHDDERRPVGAVSFIAAV